MDFFAPLLGSCELSYLRNDIVLERDSVYFDFTATGLESRVVGQRMQSILGKYANTHSANSRNANFIGELYARSKAHLRELLELDEDFLIIPSGYGATGAMKRFQELKGIYVPPRLRANLGALMDSAPKIRTLIGSYEHHSNEVSLREALCEIVRIPLKNGLMSMDALKSLVVADSAIDSVMDSARDSADSTMDSARNSARDSAKKADFRRDSVKKADFRRDSANNLDSANDFNLDSTAESTQKIALASINIASNVSGIIAPFAEISRILRTQNIEVAFDLATLLAHQNVDCALFDAAFLSPHKLVGGIGACGILCIRKNCVDSALPPTFGGGGSVKYVSENYHFYIDDIEVREDAGTPPILPLLRAVLAYQYRNEVGLDFIKKREKVLREIALSELKQIRGIALYGADLEAEYLPIISFNVEGVSPYDLAWELSNNYGIETRAGCSCAGVYGHYLTNKDEIKDISLLDTGMASKPAWLRISLHYTHTFNDIERLIYALKRIIRKY